MITKEEYLKALDTVELFRSQFNIKELRENQEKKEWLSNFNLIRNDYIRYIGGETLKNKGFTNGLKYRLTGAPYGQYVAVINDLGKRRIENSKYFVKID